MKLRKRALRAFAAATFLMLSAQGGLAQSDIASAVDDFVREEMERQKVPGVAVAMIRQGEVVVAKGYGVANLEHQVPVGPQTIFQSGSVGKQFTASRSTCQMLRPTGRPSLSATC